MVMMVFSGVDGAVVVFLVLVLMVLLFFVVVVFMVLLLFFGVGVDVGGGSGGGGGCDGCTPPKRRLRRLTTPGAARSARANEQPCLRVANRGVGAHSVAFVVCRPGRAGLCFARPSVWLLCACTRVESVWSEREEAAAAAEDKPQK